MKLLKVILVLVLVFSITGCSFNVVRQLTVMSLVTNDVLFQMTGKMSIQPKTDRLEIIVENDNGIYKKHFVHLGDNITYIVEDLGTGKNNVSKYKYSLRYNPKMWITVEVKPID